MNLACEGVLGREVRRRRGHARVAHHRERLRGALSRHGDCHAVPAGGHDGSLDHPLVDDDVLGFLGVGRTQVPDEAVGTGASRDGRIARRVGRTVDSRARVGLARIRANHGPGAVEEREGDVTRGLVLKPVGHSRARKGVLPGRGGRSGAPTAEKAQRRLGREQVQALARERGCELSQRGDVVEHPERPSVRRDDQVAPVDRDVAHRAARQVELQRLPAPAVVERHVDADLGAGEQQAPSHRILADRACVCGRRNTRNDFRPRLAVVRRLEQVGREVVLLVAVGGEIGDGGVEVGGLEQTHAGEPAQGLGGDVVPRRAAVARQVDHAVVRSGPQHACLHGGFGEGEDRAVPLRAGHVTGDRSAHRAEGGGIVNGQVGADRLPAGAAVAGLEHFLRRDIQRVPVVRREDDREGPLEPVRHVGCRVAVVIVEPHGHVAGLSRAMVIAGQRAHVGACKHDARIARLRRDVTRLAARHGVPVA